MKTTQERPFPAELLNAGAAERVEHFVKRINTHTTLHDSFEQTMSAIGSTCGPKVVIVAGPTGVGKTTLARHVYKTLLQAYQQEMEDDPGAIPVFGFNAIPPNGSSFNWKDFYIRLLERHGDVLTDRKVLVPRQHELFDDMAAPLPIERSTTEALRRAAERCMKHRKTKVLIIDEAHHILMAKDPARLEFQFEALKSLTIESDVVIVLVGTYRLLAIRDQSGQLVRRSEIVHFPRYDPNTPEGARSFKSILLTLQRQLPLAVEPDLAKDAKYFFVKAGGCVGILKDWLARCLEGAVQRKMDTFDASFAEEFSIPNKSLLTILNEALDGEQNLEDVDLEEVRQLIYRTVRRHDRKKALTGQDRSKPAGKRKRPGERNPVRDKVGVHHETP